MYSLIFNYLALSILTLVFAAHAESNLNLTRCDYNSSNGFLLCNSILGSERCQAKFEGVAKEFKQFAIGELKSIGGANPLMWFRLHPKKEDNSGWWYYKSIIDLNTKYSIHSSGKKSSNEKGFVINDDICWTKMVKIIKQENKYEIIKAEKFHFKASLSLTKNNFHKIKMIGLLNIN